MSPSHIPTPMSSYSHVLILCPHVLIPTSPSLPDSHTDSHSRLYPCTHCFAKHEHQGFAQSIGVSVLSSASD